VPLFDYSDGDCHCLDLHGSFGGSVGQVIEFIHDDSRRLVNYPSLIAWLSTIVAGLEQLEEDDDEDPDSAAFIASENFFIFERRLNPGFPMDFPDCDGNFRLQPDQLLQLMDEQQEE